MARLSSRTSDTILSSYRAHLPFEPASEPVALAVAAAVAARGREPMPGISPQPGSERRRLWELSPTLHCSIIGTCLTAGELREILRRIARREGFVVATTIDHDLHSLAVRLAERRDGPGKLLHKALDRRHAAAIAAFASAKDESDVEAQWRDALASGAIPGAYWSVLTHPFTGERLVRRAFGEVHMLSHLVGASNRADIRRLRALEEHNAQLQAELSEQRRGWRHALAERDARLRRLEAQLQSLATARAAPEPAPAPAPAMPPEDAARERLAALEGRLARESERRAVAEERCREAQAELASEREARSVARGRDRRSARRNPRRCKSSCAACSANRMRRAPRRLSISPVRASSWSAPGRPRSRTGARWSSAAPASFCITTAASTTTAPRSGSRQPRRSHPVPRRLHQSRGDVVRKAAGGPASQAVPADAQLEPCGLHARAA